jgi:hypothetical protein
VPNPGIRARLTQQAALQELSPGELALASRVDLSLPAGTSSTLMRELDRVQLFGLGDYHVGGRPALVEIDRGRLQISARSQDVHVAVPGGFIVAHAAEGGSDCELRVNDQEGTLSVTRGQVVWNGADKPTHITPGEPFHWRINAQRADADDASHDMPPPDRASFRVRAGESFVVHAPELPVAVAVQVAPGCEGQALLELNGGTRYRGTTEVRLWLAEPVRNYSVRCFKADGAKGPVTARANVRVLRDSGTRDLPKEPPVSLIDTDGRNYTIYYQNQIPGIRVRWPKPPSAADYQLDVDGQVASVAAPEQYFASGKLRDGVHRLTFAAKDRRSRTANVELRFDNTSTTASLSAPADRSFAPGAAVDIDGVALPAWKVSVDGGTIEKIGDDRFHGRIVTSQDQPDFAVRLAHPRLGTHYYLRRATGSP